MDFDDIGNDTTWSGNGTDTDTVTSMSEVFTDLPPLLSSDSLKSGLVVFDCVLTPIFTVFGVFGNVASIVILLHHNMRNGVNICLAALAISDSLFLVTSMLRRATCIIDRVSLIDSQWYFVRTFGLVFYLNLVFSRVTSVLTVLITANRFVAVILPFRMKFWSTRRKMILTCVFIYAGCALMLLPIAIIYEPGEMFLPDRNMTIPYLKPTTFLLENTAFVTEYSQTFLVIFFRHVPLLLLLIMNLCIWVGLRRSHRIRNRLSQKSESNEDQASITKMLLIISCLFFICLVPGSMAILLNQTVFEFSTVGRYKNVYSLVTAITLFLEVVNSSVNFIVYMALSKTFSDTYKQIFCRFKSKQRSNDPDTQQTNISTP